MYNMMISHLRKSIDACRGESERMVSLFGVVRQMAPSNFLIVKDDSMCYAWGLLRSIASTTSHVHSASSRLLCMHAGVNLSGW